MWRGRKKEEKGRGGVSGEGPRGHQQKTLNPQCGGGTWYQLCLRSTGSRSFSAVAQKSTYCRTTRAKLLPVVSIHIPTKQLSTAECGTLWSWNLRKSALQEGSHFLLNTSCWAPWKEGPRCLSSPCPPRPVPWTAPCRHAARSFQISNKARQFASLGVQSHKQ